MTSWSKLLSHTSWFLISRLAVLGFCVGIPLGLGWLLGWIFK